jgi:hypothetical protein
MVQGWVAHVVLLLLFCAMNSFHLFHLAPAPPSEQKVSFNIKNHTTPVQSSVGPFQFAVWLSGT